MLILGAAVAGAPAPADGPGAATITPAPQAATFMAWLDDFRRRARGAGIAEATLARELDDLAYDPRVVELDRAQPDRAGARLAFGQYLAQHVDGRRTGRGARELAALAPALDPIEARYGVPGPVLVAVWGMETDYGAYAGKFDLVRSLASLAWDGRRRALFEGELIAALRLIDTGKVTRAALTGSWAGATGQPQFLPSTYASLGADGDGDGRADIWGNAADSLASIGNYLKANGWRAGARWGMPVLVPTGLERWRVRSITPPTTCARPLALHSRWLSVREWRALGLADVAAHGWPADDTLATLIEPDGEGQGAYLAFGNYRALLGYNCSNFYALSVGLLSDRL